MEEKYILNLIYYGWLSVRRECFSVLGEKLACPAGRTSPEAFLRQFLASEFDIYSIYLKSDLDSYLRGLFQVYLMFLRLGKKNYVQLAAVYLAILEHWRVEQPELLAAYNATLPEEEIELFYETVCPYTDHKTTPGDLGKRSIFMLQRARNRLDGSTLRQASNIIVAV